MRIKFYVQLTFLVMLLGGSLSPVIAADAADPNIAKAQQIIENADKARKKAASVKGEWRDTGKMIEKAKATLKKGETVGAMKIAAQAHKQGVLGYQQAMAQQKLQMPSYLKYE